jgi:hypothetical protein
VFDKAQVYWVGINVAAGDAWEDGGATWGDTYVDIDSITFSTLAASNVTFDADVAGMVPNENNTHVDGSTVTWVGP